MRHRKDTAKFSRTGSHNRCMMANLLKSLIVEEKIVTTVAKAKELRRYADRMITLAKRNTLASRRCAISRLMVRYNNLSNKESRQAKEGDQSVYNGDRQVVAKLFNTLGPRFAERQGGYTRLVKADNRRGDNAPKCIVEFLSQ